MAKPLTRRSSFRVWFLGLIILNTGFLSMGAGFAPVLPAVSSTVPRFESNPLIISKRAHLFRLPPAQNSNWERSLEIIYRSQRAVAVSS